MKTWKVPVSWSMMATIKIEAETLGKACRMAMDEKGKIPIPADGEYLGDSWRCDVDGFGCDGGYSVEEVRDLYNSGQADEKKAGYLIVQTCDSGTIVPGVEHPEYDCRLWRW